MHTLGRFALLLVVLVIAPAAAHAKAPEGWPFIEFNEAVRAAKKAHKPMFVYFGFETCPYCEYVNKNTFSSDALRKLYMSHYVLAYFDIRGNPADVITLPGDEKVTRAEAMKQLRSSPVPAWMFVSPDGEEILMRRGSRTTVDAFTQFDMYVSSGAYRASSLKEYLDKRGLREAKAAD